MYGRGGAGNINAARESSKKSAENLEANRSPSFTAAPPSQPSNASQDYAHMGRGGAGNWYQPTELQKEGTFTTPSDAAAVSTGSKAQVSTLRYPEGQEMLIARSGRGGAGNFVWKSEEQARKEKEDGEKRREAVREGVEKVVEAELPKPPGALLGAEKEGRGW